MDPKAKAELLIRRRVVYGRAAFAELVVWRLPQPVKGSLHSYKYRFAYIVEGRRVVGFDNERGKGDHRHDGEQEYAYKFESIDALVEDFVAAVEEWRVSYDEA